MLIRSRHLLALFSFLSFIDFSTNSLSFVAHNSIDGHLRFREGSNITLVCTIMPYTGVLSFSYNFSSVYECTASYCTEKNDNKEFKFRENIRGDHAEFTWTVCPVKMAHNGKMFQCSDGRNIHNITAVVEASQYSGATKQSRQHYWALFTVLVIFLTSQTQAL